MGVKVRLLRPWKHYKTGFILDTSGGVADMLVNRLRPPAGEIIEDEVATLVPLTPGLGQVVSAVADIVGKRRKDK